MNGCEMDVHRDALSETWRCEVERDAERGARCGAVRGGAVQFSSVQCSVQSVCSQCAVSSAGTVSSGWVERPPPAHSLAPPSPGAAWTGCDERVRHDQPSACACSGPGFRTPPCCLRLQLSSRCAGAWCGCVHARGSLHGTQPLVVPPRCAPWKPLKPTTKGWLAGCLHCSA